MADHGTNRSGVVHWRLLAIGVWLLLAGALGYANRVRLGLALGVIHAVEFADPLIEAAVRKRLRQPEGPLLERNVQRIGVLILPPEVRQDRRAVMRQMDLGGIERCNVRELMIRFAEIDDLGPVGAMPSLLRLELTHCRLDDLGPLDRCVSLKDLSLEYSFTRGLSTISGLERLRTLNLSRTQIGQEVGEGDLGPLRQLKGLEELDLTGTTLIGPRVYNESIEDIRPLGDLERLRELRIPHGRVSDLGPLSGLKELRFLDLRNNRVSDLRPLAGLENLRVLKLDHNLIEDISPLLENPGLGAGDSIDLRDNPLDEDSLTIRIPELKRRGVNVQFGPYRGLPARFPTSLPSGATRLPE